METKTKMSVLELLKRPINVDEYKLIREEWITHSKAEDRRDIPGLMSTLTDDCMYQVMGTGKQWHGKAGATQFYTELLTAFPDIHFDLQNIVIGPQGVYEEAHVTGTHVAAWLNLQPSGKPIEFNVIIFFPWNPVKKKFSGERVWTDFGGMMK